MQPETNVPVVRIPDDTKQIIHEPDEVKRALSELGLTEEILRQATGEAALARLETTPHHPKTAGGSNQWFTGVRSLRDQLVPLGWQQKDIQNQGLVINPKCHIVLAVAGGDAHTGRIDGHPTTRSKKGPTMKEAIDNNQYRLALPSEYFVLPKAKSIKELGTLWLLLVYVDLELQEVRAELSRPVGYDQNRRPSSFLPRIMLRPTDLDGDLGAHLERGPNDVPTPEVVVEIKRRA